MSANLELFNNFYLDISNVLTSPVRAEEKHGLLELERERLGLDLLKRAAIDLDETLAPLGVGHGGGGLLATEGLDRLYGLLLVSHGCFCKNLRRLFSFLEACHTQNNHMSRKGYKA